MDSYRKPLSPGRLRLAWKLFQAFRAGRKGHFDNALQLLDEAAKIKPLGPSNRVYRADLLLGAQRVGEAHTSFAALRDEFKGSDDPNLRYLRRYCTHQLSLMTRSSDQWTFEAKQGSVMDCDASLKRRFPMVTIDDVYEPIRPRR